MKKKQYLNINNKFNFINNSKPAFLSELVTGAGHLIKFSFKFDFKFIFIFVFGFVFGSTFRSIRFFATQSVFSSVFRSFVLLMLSGFIAFSGAVITSVAAHAENKKTISKLPHLDLEMTGPEYTEIFKKQPDMFWLFDSFENKINQSTETTETNEPQINAGTLENILVVGKKNLDCLETINSNKPDSEKLQLSTPETQKGIPITEPSVSNESIILNKEKELMAKFPASLTDLFWNKQTRCPSSVTELQDLPKDIKQAEQIYLESARLVDRLYQNASRWILQVPYLSSYAARSYMDIRGFYFLQKDTNLETNLANFSNLPAEKKSEYTEWLISLCHNSQKSKTDCQKEFQSSVLLAKSQTTSSDFGANPQSVMTTAVSANGFSSKTATDFDITVLSDRTPVWKKTYKGAAVLDFYKKYLKSGKNIWSSFFDLENPRPEVYWDKNTKHLVQNFQRHADSDVRDWLKVNLEDEWKWKSFQLDIGFKNNYEFPQVIFQPGITPHVNGLGGDTIYMDANRNIQEYSSRWIIRHEYGHVLGFPDCYIEFYDKTLGVMVNYQIDIENLMCSRRGHLQEIHVKELQKKY